MKENAVKRRCYWNGHTTLFLLSLLWAWVGNPVARWNKCWLLLLGKQTLVFMVMIYHRVFKVELNDYRKMNIERTMLESYLETPLVLAASRFTMVNNKCFPFVRVFRATSLSLHWLLALGCSWVLIYQLIGFYCFSILYLIILSIISVTSTYIPFAPLKNFSYFLYGFYFHRNTWMWILWSVYLFILLYFIQSPFFVSLYIWLLVFFFMVTLIKKSKISWYNLSQ